MSVEIMVQEPTGIHWVQERGRSREVDTLRRVANSGTLKTL